MPPPKCDDPQCPSSSGVVDAPVGVSAPIADAPIAGLRQDRAVPTESDKIELSEHELREIAGYAADCARRALPIFEQNLPADTRPRDAIDAVHAFAGGGHVCPPHLPEAGA